VIDRKMIIFELFQSILMLIMIFFLEISWPG